MVTRQRYHSTLVKPGATKSLDTQFAIRHTQDSSAASPRPAINHLSLHMNCFCKVPHRTKDKSTCRRPVLNDMSLRQEVQRKRKGTTLPPSVSSNPLPPSLYHSRAYARRSGFSLFPPLPPSSSPLPSAAADLEYYLTQPIEFTCKHTVGSIFPLPPTTETDCTMSYPCTGSGNATGACRRSPMSATHADKTTARVLLYKLRESISIEIGPQARQERSFDR